MQGNGVDSAPAAPPKFEIAADEWESIAQYAMAQWDQTALALRDAQINIGVLNRRLYFARQRIAELEGGATTGGTVDEVRDTGVSGNQDALQHQTRGDGGGGGDGTGVAVRQPHSD